MKFKRAKKGTSFKLNWSETQRKIVKNAFDVSLPIVIGLVCYNLFLHIGLFYETNDDSASLFMLSSGDDFTMIFSKPLSTFISNLMSNSPDIPVWVFVSLITITVSLIISLFVLRKRLTELLFWPVAVFVVFFFTTVAVTQINFTRTAAAAAVAGVMLILQGIVTFSKQGKMAKVVSIVEVLVGTAVWFWGAMIRDLVAYLILPFAGLFVLFYTLSRTGRFNIKQFFMNLRTPIIVSVAALSAAIIASIFAYNMYTVEERAAIEHYKARIDVQDYKDNYPEYKEAQDEYLSLGVTESEYNMIFHSWTTEDTDFFTTELYTALRENLYTQNSLEEAVNVAIEFILDNSEIWIATLIFLLLLTVYLRGWRKLYLPIFLICAFAYVVFLAMQGRVLARAVDPVLLYIVLIGAMLCSSDNINTKQKWYLSRHYIAPFLLVVAIASFIAPKYDVIFQDYAENVLKSEEAYFGQSYPEIAHEFYDYIGENSETAYLLTISDGISFMPATNIPIFVPPDIDIANNLFFLGGWDVRSPANYSRLAQYGIENPMEAIVENQNVLTIYSEMLHGYLTDHYGDEVSVSMATTLIFTEGGRMDFVKFTRPIDEIIPQIDLENRERNEIELSQFFYALLPEGYVNVPTHDTLCVKGQLSEWQMEQYTELYLNIETEKERNSYGIHIEEDGSFLTYAFGPDEDILDDSIEISLVARDTSGELILTNILTEMFMYEEEDMQDSEQDSE